MRRFVGLSFGFLVRVWLWTLRVKLYSPVELSTMPPSVFAFWHGRQMPLLAARRRRPSVAMVSRSVDGEAPSGSAPCPRRRQRARVEPREAAR